MKKMFLLLCFLEFVNVTYAQQLMQERLYKISNTPTGFGSSTITREGNVLLAGSYTANFGYQSILALIKPNTDSLWVQNGPLISVGGFGIRQAPNNGYFFYTTQRYTSPSGSGTVLLRFDSKGVIKSSFPYNINTFDSGHLLLNASDSGYYLGGKNIIGGKNSRFALSRTDSLGNLKWRKGYDWNNNDFLSDMQYISNGNIIMYGITGGPQRLKLLLLNQHGDSILGRQLTVIGGNRNERLWSNNCSVTPLSDGGFLLAAEIDTLLPTTSRRLGMVVKADANLQPVWHYINRSLPDNVTFTRSRELTDGSVVMLGFERKGASGTPGNNFFLYRFSAAGALLNVYTFTSSIATQIQALTLEALPDSSFIIGGSGVITPAPNFSSGFYVAKVKIAGLPPALPLPGPMVVTGVKPAVAASDALGQSYPNPATMEATIPYALKPTVKEAELRVFEVATGRIVQVVRLDVKARHINLDLKPIKQGIYSYTLVEDGIPTATRKMVVLK